MKLSRTSWLILGIGIFVIAAYFLFQSYQEGVEERDKAKDSLASAQATLPTVIADKGSAELELIQTEEELQEMQTELGQLETELAQAEETLEQTVAKLPVLVESIEYDDLLFNLAADANLNISSLTASEAVEIVIDGMDYAATTFAMSVQGEMADILDFINRIVTGEDFNTAILRTVSIAAPRSLTEAEKEIIREEIRDDLTEDALDELTTEDIVGFWVEAIEQVTGQEIETKTVEEITATIEEKIAGILADEDIEASLPGALAESIEGYIKGSLWSNIVGPLAQELADSILEEDLNDLLGEDIVELLGEGPVGSLQGNITSLLTEHITELVEGKMEDSAAELVDEEEVGKSAADEIEELEKPSANINLIIHTYQGEGE